MIIETKTQLINIVQTLKKEGKKVLVKKGVFDIIHPGHIFAINQYSIVSDIVIILVQSDELTRKRKGALRPINSQQQRAIVIDSIKGVDYVFLDKSGSREEYLSFLLEAKPSIVAITSSDSNKSKSYENPIWKLMEFPEKDNSNHSTTKIINQIVEKHSLLSSQ